MNKTELLLRLQGIGWNDFEVSDVIFYLDEKADMKNVSVVGIAASKIKENISKLKKKGLIERIGADKGGYWKVVK